MRQINQRIWELNEIANDMLVQLQAMQIELDDVNAQLERIEAARSIIGDITNDLQDGALTRDADGTLTNKDAQKMLDEYIQRTGIVPQNDSEILIALTRQMNLIAENEDNIRQRKEELERRIRETQEGYDRTIEEKEALEKKIQNIMDIEDISERERALNEVMQSLDSEERLLLRSNAGKDLIATTSLLKKGESQVPTDTMAAFNMAAAGIMQESNPELSNTAEEGKPSPQMQNLRM